MKTFGFMAFGQTRFIYITNEVEIITQTFSPMIRGLLINYRLISNHCGFKYEKTAPVDVLIE